MEKKIYHGEWVTRSDIPNRQERLKAHMEFESSDLKKMLDTGWKIASAKKAERPRRPRIKKEPKEPFKMFGTIKVNFEIPIEVLIKAGFAR